jgi:hypothetical protein
MRAGQGSCGVCGHAPAPYVPDSASIEVSVSGTFDPLFNSRYAKQLVRRGVLYAGVAGFLDFVVFLLNLLIALAKGSVGLLGFAPVLWVISVIVVFVVFATLPVPALLGEWHRLLTFRASEAESTLDYIHQAVKRHHTPYDSLGPKPITPPGEGRKLYLELRRGFFAGYVSSFAHGDDLYVGWTFWIYVSPIRALIMRLGRKVQDYTGRGNDIYQTLRFESAQATIGAMHACTLEGIEFATGESYQPPAAALPQAPQAPAPPAPPAPAVREAARARADAPAIRIPPAG